MTATITTAADLYAVSGDFRAFLDCWERDRRCPLPLVDFLLEQGLERQAEAARWAATEPDREVFLPIQEHGERIGYCGPFPTLGDDAFCNPVRLNWYFRPVKKHEEQLTPHRVPFQFLKDRDRRMRGTPQEAIVALLDNWK